MTLKLHLSWLSVCVLLAVGSGSSREYVADQTTAKANDQSDCQELTCATITGTIDARKLPPRKDRPFLITLYPAPYGQSVATIAAAAGQVFTLPPQKPGSYVISVSGYTSKCWIKWKKKIKLRAGETKKVNPKPYVVPNVGCE